MSLPVVNNRASRNKRTIWSRALEWYGWESRQALSLLLSGKGLTDYNQYPLTRKAFITIAALGALSFFGAAYLFYHSIIVACIFASLGMLVPRYRRRTLIERRKQRLKLQFKEALFSLISSLAAGRSIENAFLAAYEDLQLLYPDAQTELLQEFQIIRFRLEHAEPLEAALRNMAERAHIEELTQFADVLAACKRSGGDLVEVMKRTSAIICEKLETEQEIAVLLAQKKLEGRIMMAVPFVFLAFLGLAAPDYMSPLYNGFGYVLLTAGLIVLLLLFLVMDKILRIRM
jgi:tight adherence protein B